MPDHKCYHYGERVKQRSQKVLVGGAFGGEGIGYVGFTSGPQKHLIDKVGLSDPLLARLPAVQPSNINKWKSGHFHRNIPAGYVKSVATGKNLLREPDIRHHYDFVRTITLGSVFSLHRLNVIANMNLGRYRHLLISTET